MPITAPPISARKVARLPDGRSVDAWTLVGAGGLTLEALTYGGIVTKLLVPDRLGNIDDVVLGFTDAESYFAPHPYFGAIVGRNAGRLTASSFSLDGKVYPLAANEGPTHLHGGLVGFDKRIWNAEPIARADGAPSVRLHYISPAGEEGYPGTLDVSITYTVLPDNTFQIDTHASTDAATPFNPTHHSYFNLGGEAAGSIADHKVQIFSDQFSETDDALLHTGRHLSVRGEPNDFNHPRLLAEALPLLPKLNGDLYLIRKTTNEMATGQLVLAARVTHDRTGRMLTVSTNEPCVQLYTGSSLDGTLIGKSGRPYAKHAAFCLECQANPNAPNHPELGDITLRPGDARDRTALYSFSTF
jgi:aldose 1-epimerase